VVDDILRVSIVSQVEHHLYFPESFLYTLCTNVPQNHRFREDKIFKSKLDRVNALIKM